MRIVDPRDKNGNRLLTEKDLANTPTYEDIAVLNAKDIIRKVEKLHEISPDSVAFTNSYDSLEGRPDIGAMVAMQVDPVAARVEALENSELKREDILDADNTFTGENRFEKTLDAPAGLTMGGQFNINLENASFNIASSLPLSIKGAAITLDSATVATPKDANYRTLGAATAQIRLNAEEIETLKGRTSTLEEKVDALERALDIPSGAVVATTAMVETYVGGQIDALKVQIAPSGEVKREALYVTGQAVIDYCSLLTAKIKGDLAPATEVVPNGPHVDSNAIISYVSAKCTEVLDAVHEGEKAFTTASKVEEMLLPYAKTEDLDPFVNIEQVRGEIAAYDATKTVLDSVEETSAHPVKSSGIWAALQPLHALDELIPYKDILLRMARERKALEFSTVHLLYSKSPTLMAVLQQVHLEDLQKDSGGLPEDGFTPSEWEDIRKVADLRANLDSFFEKTKVGSIGGVPVEDKPLYTDETLHEGEVAAVRDILAYREVLFGLIAAP